MTSKEIENNVAQIIQNFSQEEFIYDLLLAYGISKTSITRLKKFVFVCPTALAFGFQISFGRERCLLDYGSFHRFLE